MNDLNPIRSRDHEMKILIREILSSQVILPKIKESDMPYPYLELYSRMKHNHKTTDKNSDLKDSILSSRLKVIQSKMKERSETYIHKKSIQISEKKMEKPKLRASEISSNITRKTSRENASREKLFSQEIIDDIFSNR